MMVAADHKKVIGSSTYNIYLQTSVECSWMCINLSMCMKGFSLFLAIFSGAYIGGI